MSPVNVLGAGVFGAVIARVMEREGYQVTVVDDGRPHAGSVASAGLIHDSWSPLPTAETKAAMALLDELFGLRVIRFRAGVKRLTKEVTVHQVSPSQFLLPPGVAQTATVTQLGSGWARVHRNGDGQQPDTLVGVTIACLGAWSSAVWPKVPVVGKVGWAYRAKGTVPVPTITLWAPYKQLIVFERDPGEVWGGDGTALLEKNATPLREGDSYARVSKAMPLGLKGIGMLRGVRPYLTGQKLGLCQEIMPRTWMATGGAKGGTLLAAHYALQLRQLLKGHVTVKGGGRQ